jgi:hypothetical protein
MLDYPASQTDQLQAVLMVVAALQMETPSAKFVIFPLQKSLEEEYTNKKCGCKGVLKIATPNAFNLAHMLKIKQ